MYITKKMKAQLTAAGVDIFDKQVVKNYYAEQYKLRIAAEEEEKEARLNMRRRIQAHCTAHPSTAEDQALYDLIERETNGKFYKWLYMEPLSFSADESLISYWKELRYLNVANPQRYDLTRLVAAGLLFMVEGHYKTKAQLKEITVYDKPVQYFKNREKAIEFLLKKLPAETIRLDNGNTVFELHDLAKELLGTLSMGG